MKTIRGLTANRSPRVNMRIRILALLALSSLAGCHRKEVEVSNQSQNSADIGTPLKTASDGKPEALPPPPPKVAATADNYVRQNVNGLVDPKLTAQLRDFVQKYGRLPLSFTEFANRGLDSTPSPPDGTKWVIDGPNQQVKAVAMRR